MYSTEICLILLLASTILEVTKAGCKTDNLIEFSSKCVGKVIVLQAVLDSTVCVST